MLILSIILPTFSPKLGLFSAFVLKLFVKALSRPMVCPVIIIFGQVWAIWTDHRFVGQLADKKKRKEEKKQHGNKKIAKKCRLLKTVNGPKNGKKKIAVRV